MLYVTARPVVERALETIIRQSNTAASRAASSSPWIA